MSKSLNASLIRKIISQSKLLSLAVTSFLFIGIFVTVLATLQVRDPNSRASNNGSLEAESFTLSNSVTLGSDATASGGQFIQFNQIPNNFQPTAPYYSTFFYPWSQNPNIDGIWSYWSDSGHNPPQNWFSNYLPDPNPNAFDPANELYSSNNYSIFQWQLSKLAEAKQEVGISSWWGQGHKTDVAFRNIVTDFMNRPDNPYPNFRWAFYYEKEGFGNPSVDEITSDLNYILTNYSNEPSLLKIQNKPVMFAYGDETDDCSTVTRWKTANSNTGNKFYINLKVFPNYQSCPDQPDSWHQYSPAVRSDAQASYSYMISPGFWLNGSPVRLQRDLPAFSAAASSMVASNATWKLTETWNEWGEGTAVEPGEEVIQTTSGNATANPNGATFKNAYVNSLNQALPSLPQGSGVINECSVLPSSYLTTTTIDIATAGTYSIWSRINTTNSTKNSFYMQIDGGCGMAIGGSSITPNTWTWVNYQKGDASNKTVTNLTTGTHVINLFSKDTGVKLDRLLLTSDQTCTPIGTGSNCPITPTAPTADLKVNNSDGPVTVANGTNATLSWTSTNATTCTASNDWSGTKATNGSEATGSLTSSKTYTLNCTGNGGSNQDSVTVTVSAPVDTQPPSITITAPTTSQIVSGTFNVTTNSSDNTGVTKVEFYLDNALINTDMSAPYSYNIDTTVLANTSHSLVAKAYDAANNSTSSTSISFVVMNQTTTPPPAPTSQPEDLNKDGLVNIYDLSLLLSKWGSAEATADIDKSGKVDIFDLSRLLSKWGS